MRILHVCQFLGVGGLEQVLYLLIKHQLELGHKVEMIVYDHDRRWVPKFQKLGITVHTEYTKKPGVDWALLPILNRFIPQYDIIHTHDLNPAIYLSLLKIKNWFKGKKTTFIHTTHGMEHITQEPETRWYERLIGFCAHKIITVSPKFKEYYSSQWFTRKHKIHQIDNGTEIAATFQRAAKNSFLKDLGLNPTKPTAVYVARVVPLKGQKELIDFYKNSEHQLLLVGPSGDESYYKQCEKSLTPNIKMLGSRSDINEILDQSDYYISYSFHEGLPISVLEAGSRKVPCLLYDIPGHKQFNTRDEAVCLFNEKNLKEKQTEFMAKKEQLATHFFELILEKYSSLAMTKKVLAIYREVTDAA